jgi:arylsulfatase A-like enzyme
MKKLSLVICMLAVACEGFARTGSEQPNIILLVADDLGYGELGCQGNRQVPTPNIDSIAASGIRFTQGYVTAPNCSPSRAGFLTGRIPTRFGYEFNPIAGKSESPGVGLPDSETTLAELLRGVGYTTGLVGKWHLGATSAYHPQRHGFDEFFGFLHEGHFYVPAPWRGVTSMLRRRSLPGNKQGRLTAGHLIYSTHTGRDEPAYDANNPILRGGQPVEEKAHLTDAFTREAVDFVSRHQDKPFFLYVAYNAIHSPMQGADAYMKKFAHLEDVQRRIFAAMLAHLDNSVGQVLECVRKEKLEERTLIFFFSDNGGPTRELTSSNLPLRGEKGSMYEGGLRVPFMAQWKGRLAAGRTYEKFVVSVDIFATAAKVAGAAAPANIDGVDLLPYLLGQNSGLPHETFFWRQGPKSAFRKGNWKVVGNRQGQKERQWELYDLSKDISEKDNVGGQNPEKLAELKLLWEQANNETAEPLFR